MKTVLTPAWNYSVEMKIAAFLVVFLALVALCSAAGNSTWSYGNADKWPSLFPKCHKNTNYRQSPVDIRTDRLVYRPDLVAPILNGYKNPGTFLLLNAGPNFKFSVIQKPVYSATFRGKSWTLDSAHLHWGNSKAPGSEHTINGHRFTAEIHVVHHLSNLTGLAQAIKEPDGLLVLGFFLEVDSQSQQNHPGYATLFSKLAAIQKPGMNLTFTIAPEQLLPHNYNSDVFYNYDGGLTTPNCYGVVQWLVFKTPIKITAEQMGYLWHKAPKDRDDRMYGMNYRQVQDLGTRMVKVNKNPNVVDPNPKPASAAFRTPDKLVLLVAAIFVLKNLF